ncbi:MAG: recombinase RecT [Methylobacter sp.]
MSQQLIQRQNQLKPLLVSAQRQITSLLQDEAKAKRFMAASLVVASSTALNKCAPDSIVQALVGVAMSDLNIDSNIGHCYLVPYGDSVQLQIGYKGFIQLLFRAGWLVKAFPVYTCDDFSMSFDGWDNRVDFTPSIDDRDEGDKDWVFNNLRGIYVVSRHADTKDEYSMFVNKTVIEKLRLNSPNQKIGKYTKPDDLNLLQNGKPIGIWKDWYIEMAQSKAIKKLAKILPIGDSRAQIAIAADDSTESGKPVDYKGTAESGVIIDLKATESTTSSSNTQSIFDEIKAAVTLDELNVISKKISSLKGKEQQDAVKLFTEKSESLKKEAPIENGPGLSISKKISECKTHAEIDELESKLSADEWETYRQALDDARDWLR